MMHAPTMLVNVIFTLTKTCTQQGICCCFVVVGAQWHPSSPTDQKHCTKLDLPNFIHNYYENCHGPPRLFLLDKYCLSNFFPAYTSNQFGYNQRILGLGFRNVPSFFRGSTIKILRV